MKILIFLALITFAALAALAIERARRWLLLRSLRNRTEHIYIVGMAGKQEPALHPMHQPWVEVVPCRQVEAHRALYEGLLKASGNATGCQVLTWQYQYAEHCNETLEEYSERIATDIANHRRAQHKAWAEGDKAHYQKWVMQQKKGTTTFEWK